LSERISYLQFIDDEIGNMALTLSERMFNVSLIRYDVDEFGNPLVSKRSRRLIEEMCALEKNATFNSMMKAQKDHLKTENIQEEVVGNR